MKATSWLHDGDQEPTRYGSYAELARKLGVARNAVSYYVRRGIDGDESRRQAQNARKGFTARSYVATPVIYEGVTYPSIRAFGRASGLSWYSTLKLLGRDVSKYSGTRSTRNKARVKAKWDAVQKLALKAKGEKNEIQSEGVCLSGAELCVYR